MRTTKKVADQIPKRKRIYVGEAEAQPVIEYLNGWEGRGSPEWNMKVRRSLRQQLKDPKVELKDVMPWFKRAYKVRIFKSIDVRKLLGQCSRERRTQIAQFIKTKGNK